MSCRLREQLLHPPVQGAPRQRLGAQLADAQRELQACRQQQEWTRGALQAIADGVVTVDLDARITFMNPVAAHLTGWSEAQALGRRFDEVVCMSGPHGDRLDVLDMQPDCGIASLRRRDAHVILVDGAVAPILDGERQVIGSVVSFRNVTAATRMTNELTYHANHDPLTGLDNRRAFQSRLQRAVATAAGQGCQHSLLYFDLDRFKIVNDRAGHAAGDEVLRQLAIALRRQLRESDALARLGGDEFAVLLEDCTPDQADIVAEKIRTETAAFEIDCAGLELRIGASIGRVDFNDGALSPSQLMVRADKMCYVAKSLGRDRVAVHSGSAPTAHAAPHPARSQPA